MRFRRSAAAPVAATGSLEHVLEAERAAARAIAAAREEAAAWLVAERRAIEHEHTAAANAIVRAYETGRCAAHEAAERARAARVAEAQQLADRMSAIGDEQMQPVVAAHLRSLLPGARS